PQRDRPSGPRICRKLRPCHGLRDLARAALVRRLGAAPAAARRRRAGQTPCARLSRVPWGQTDRPEHNRRQVMIESHSGALLVGYATALLGWLLLSRAAPSLWPQRAPIRFARPWLEVAVSLLAVVAVLAIGQLYIRGWLLPEAGSLKPLLAALNQIL